MAILTVDSLTGCNSIPDFIPSGTRTIFYNTNSPSSWTKDTTSHNDKALRVTNGSVSSGGTSPFLTVFPATSRSVQGTVSTAPNIGASVVQKTITADGPVTTGQIDAITQSPITVSSWILQESQIAQHTHSCFRRPNTSDLGLGITAQPQNTLRVDNQVVQGSFGDNTAVTGHSHGIATNAQVAGTRDQHSHPVTATQHTHPISAGPHNHLVSPGSVQDFSISYVDVIIAQKD